MAPKIPEVEETSPPPQGRAFPPAARRRRYTPGDVRRFLTGWVPSSPGTHLWLAVLAATTCVAAGLPSHLRSYLLHSVSTNLDELGHHPIRVLIASALWIETPSGFVFYAVLFELLHATAERWLGTARWLLVAALAHVGATLVSQRAVFSGIRAERLPRSLEHTIDIGVSYGLAGIVGVLAYRVPWPWRWGYLAAVLAFFAYPVISRGTFTDLGHLTALLIGLCCWAVTPPGRTAGAAPARSRPRRWRR
ncbi:rhomboid-like protein [Streptomyces polygonati]|uniref:Rhomboid-like protein n=1 Tax=Streptomyces polygonati TaxID=1617087 RepID=A0ABV8HQX4_9ACTN